MKTGTLTSVVLLLLITALPGVFQPVAAAEEEVALPHPEVARIDAEELRDMLDNKADVVVVDTRDGLSYEDGHIPSAINVYYDPIADPSTREMTLVALPMNRQIVIYCP